MADADAKTEPTDDAKLARYWLAEIDTAEKDPKRTTWLKRCKGIVQLYTEAKTTESTSKRFALFWSNIEVLKPAVLARNPIPVVNRRFKDADPVGRYASEVLERALKFAIDCYDFEAVLTGCRDEFLLVAQGVPWVRYVPHIVTKGGDDTEGQITTNQAAYEDVEWEEVRADKVSYTDFLHNVCREWAEVWWTGRIAYLTREELIDRFGEEKGKQVPLDWMPEGQPNAPETSKKAAVYEIWDKTKKRAIWVSKGCTEWVLDAKPDPLKLKDFFPCPKPAFGTLGPDSAVPIPDYIYYQDQLHEIDVLTARISKLIDALKVRGLYSASDKQPLDRLLASDDAMLIPVDSWAALGDKGGLKGIIEWFPLDMIAATIKECIATRKEIIGDVYQLTGISDIQRGDTDPDETLGAQELKAGYGSARVHERKKELARLARDTLDIKGQIIASRFDQKTLAEMSDVKLLTKEEKAQVQLQLQAVQKYQAMQQQMQQQAQMQAQQAQQAQQQGAPAQPPPAPRPMPVPPPAPDPKQVELMSEPTWDEVMALLRSPSLRAYRIDIETDSTIEPNDQAEKQRRIEFVEAVGQFVANALPVVQAMPAMVPVITQSLLFLVRGFRVGREMEDVIEQAMEKLSATPPATPEGAPAPDPAIEKAKADAALKSAEAATITAQASQQKVGVEAFKAQSAHQIGMAQVEAENTRTHVQAADNHHDRIAETIQKAADRQATKEINDRKPIEAKTP